MKNIVRIALVSVALAGAGQALAAGGKKGEPNCEVKGKKTHTKDQKACEAKKGTWLNTTPAAAPAAAPAAPAATDSATSAPATPAPAAEAPATK